MMNNANEISHHTMLYGFIGEEAGQSSMSATLNKLFKANNKDAMMIPMNIREDDLYFTVANMKRSHVNGAFISNEYIKNIVEILDEASDTVKISGICDVMIREGEKLLGDVVGVKAIIEFLKDNGCKKVALIGIEPKAKAFASLAKELEIGYFYDNLESLMGFIDEMKIENADINRIAKGMSIDMSSYDAVVDLSDLDDLLPIEKLAEINLDMKSKKEFSPLKVRANEIETVYIGLDDMYGKLSEVLFEYFKEKKHLEHDKSDMRF